jgi:hypothetical protein
MLNDFLSKVARDCPTPIRLEEIEFKGKPMEGEGHARIYEADCHVKLAVRENKAVLVEVATRTGMLKLEVANNEITIGKFDVIETRGRRLSGFRAGTVDIAAEAVSGQKKEAMVYDPADWGGCPECHATHGYLNVLGDLGMEHWFFCENHKVRWYVGTDLFSSWRDMPSDALQKQAEQAKALKPVERWYPQTVPDAATEPCPTCGAERQRR